MSSGMPFEEAARHAVDDRAAWEGDKDHHAVGYKSLTGDFMGDLVEAQQTLITAQHKFIHNADVTGLIVAQSEFIQAQSSVIVRLLGGREQ